MSEFYQGQAQMESMFPGISEERALELIKSAERLIPIDTRDRIWYLEVLFSYVDGIINGDDIVQYTTSKITPLAKESLDEVLTHVHEKILFSYRKERSELKEEVSSLSSQKKLLEESVDYLSEHKKELLNQTVLLEKEIVSKRSEYDNLRNNRLAEIDLEMKNAKKEMCEELSKLEEEKKDLSNSVKELKGLLDKYSSMVSKITLEKTGRCKVFWNPIDEYHPIYNCNYKTIRDYVQSLKLEFVDKTGLSMNECEREFKKNAPMLEAFADTVFEFDNSQASATASVRNIINCTNWDQDGRESALELESILSVLKLPTYTPLLDNVDNACVNFSTLPVNVQSLMRELHFQRIAMEALSKQKILEAELEVVLSAFKSVVPDSFDFTSLQKQLGSLEEVSDIKKLTL